MSTATAARKAPSSEAVHSGRHEGHRKLRLYSPLTPYLLCAPYLVLLVAFVLGPAVFGIWISLHDWDFMLPSKPFIGMGNYAALFDPESVIYTQFWHGMRATAIFTVFSVPFLVLVPLAIALLLNRKFRFRGLFRAMIFAPFVLGIAVVGVLWNYLLDTQYGLINWFLGLFGIPQIAWTQTQPWAWVGLVLMTVWWTMGFNTVIYLAGLQDIPAEQYEAAELDGAGRWSAFRAITLPGLRNVLIFIVTTTVLASANMFGQSYLVTNGGPGDTTKTAIIVMTEEGLRGFRMGTASAMSYMLAIFLGIISVIIFYLMRERKPKA